METPDPGPAPPREPELLFAYGTLSPGFEAAGARWEPDAVRGRLFDLGPYPVLVDLDDPTAGWVIGHVRPVSRRELEERLDPYEDAVAGGEFRRVTTSTRLGRAVWIYVYARPLPPTARGPLARWRRP